MNEAKLHYMRPASPVMHEIPGYSLASTMKTSTATVFDSWLQVMLQVTGMLPSAPGCCLTLVKPFKETTKELTLTF